MSVPSWQKRCGAMNGYDHEAASDCHAPLRELEQEFDAAEGSVSDWMHDNAAYAECFAKQGLTAFNRWFMFRQKKNPTNDNGRSS